MQSAQYIVGPFGPDSDLRRWGRRKAEGGKKARNRAVVAVAPKLAVLLHHLWLRDEDYEPFREGQGKEVAGPFLDSPDYSLAAGQGPSSAGRLFEVSGLDFAAGGLV